MTFCVELTVCGSNNRLCPPRLRQAASPLAATERADSAVHWRELELETELLSPETVSNNDLYKHWKVVLLLRVPFRGTVILSLTDFVNDETINPPDCNQRTGKHMKNHWQASVSTRQEKMNRREEPYFAHKENHFARKEKVFAHEEKYFVHKEKRFAHREKVFAHKEKRFAHEQKQFAHKQKQFAHHENHFAHEQNLSGSI